MQKTTKPLKAFTIKQLVRVSDLRQVMGGAVVTDVTKQKVIIVL